MLRGFTRNMNTTCAYLLDVNGLHLSPTSMAGLLSFLVRRFWSFLRGLLYDHFKLICEVAALIMGSGKELG